ncbi:MAG: acyl--CoA ligase [Pseudomonadota bacterium]|nr:acyl--CoA ligase [Pseudomonadota bacterium]
MEPTGSLPAGLERSVRLHAGRIAISAAGTDTTYTDLWARATSFAGWLRAADVGPGDRVALALEGCWQYVAAYYGALIAGAIVVPLNAAARLGELTQWTQHARARVVVGDEQLLNLKQLSAELPDETRVLGACGPGGSFEKACQGVPQRLEAGLLEPGRPACIHYTSGTTGAPKGVLLSHGNLASNAVAIIGYLALDQTDSVVTVLPFYYAYGASVLHTHLLVGGRVIVEKGFSFPHLVFERIALEGASGFAGVPSTFALLLSRVRLDSYDLGNLRYVTQAGGGMPPALTRRLIDALPGKQIYVMYGQTEATSRLTYVPPERLQEKLGAAGLPLAGVDIEIRDEERRPCGRGEVGRVWVRGPNVMLGYWRSPDATATVLHDEWLDTGDVGYVDGDGYLFLSGRRSDIIKVGAHRVHPQDVEAAIAEFPGVAEVAVAGIDDPLLGEVVKAFVVAAPGFAPSEQAIRRHCLERLAAYKVPRKVALVASLPRTASGKVRRQDLVNRE